MCEVIKKKIGRLNVEITFKDKHYVLIIKNEGGSELSNFICTDSEFIRLGLFLMQEALNRYEIVEGG